MWRAFSSSNSRHTRRCDILKFRLMKPELSPSQHLTQSRLRRSSPMTNLPSSKIYHLHEDQFNGVKLQLARERLNISRAELANRVRTSPSFITACEKCRKRPSRGLETLFAAELHVTRQYFYGAISGRWELTDCHFRHRQA